MKKHELYIIISILTILLSFSACGSKDESGGDAENQSRGNTIIETGELAAVTSKSFVLTRYGRQFYEMKIVGLLDHGTLVNEGDSIIQLDATDVKKFIIDRETALETQLATLEKMQVNQDNKNSEYDSKIKNELAAFELKKISLEASRFESDRTKKIKELEFEQAKITLAKEKRKLELNKIIDDNDFKIQEIRVQQIEKDIENSYDIIPNLTIRTPISGVFQIAWSWRSNGLMKVGDNVYPGNNMANVPDLSWMKVNTYINEVDFLKIRMGQKVAVRLDAMPKVVFDGEIAYIGKLCHPRENNSRQKVFDVEVKLLKPDDRLKPGMTVSCEFLESN
ncbi:MAG: efflux RND transporter periplasmic adaptor subunit [Prevotella sp.]|jgi:hypothetical protein|nr:efflux RND transporter periplasmic adaptor subunit [Prevotella sp.]